MANEQGNNNNNLVATLMVFFTGATALVMWYQWVENRELVKLQKQIADIQLKKLSGSNTSSDANKG